MTKVRNALVALTLVLLALAAGFVQAGGSLLTWLFLVLGTLAGAVSLAVQLRLETRIRRSMAAHPAGKGR